MKFVAAGKLLRNDHEDYPGIVIAAFKPDGVVSWAITSKEMPQVSPEKTGVFEVRGEQAEAIGEDIERFLTPEELIEHCDDGEAIQYVASAATMALMNVVNNEAPQGHAEIVGAFCLWWCETVEAVKSS